MYELKAIRDIEGLCFKNDKGICFFFDGNGICQTLHQDDFHKWVSYGSYDKIIYDPLSPLRWRFIEGTVPNVKRPQNYFSLTGRGWLTVEKNEFLNFRIMTDAEYQLSGKVWTRAKKRIHEGDSVADFETKLTEAFDSLMKPKEKSEFEKLELSEDLQRFVTKIEKPIVLRIPENERKKSFDIIRQGINLNTSFENKEQFLKDHMKDIIRMSNAKLSDSTSFKKYKVPISCLAITRIYKDDPNHLIIVYELKKELRAMESETN